MLNIVIVEDDPFLAAIYEHKFKDVDCMVQTATDGQDGFDLICETKPDLVLLDLVLPTLSGADVLERLRARKEFANLPVIVFSSSTSGALLGAARRADALYILPKEPGTPDKIVAIISRLFPGSVKKDFRPAARRTETVNAPATAAPPLAAGRRRRVLVADDNPVTLAIIKDIVEKEGYAVITAQDGREAFGILEGADDIAAAVIDVMMPYMDGTELLGRMRHEERLKNIPVLIITGRPTLQMQTASFASGLCLFAAKPFTRDELKKKFLFLVGGAA